RPVAQPLVGGPWLADVTDLLNGTPERRARRLGPSDFEQQERTGGDGPGEQHGSPAGGSGGGSGGGGGGSPVRSLSPADLAGMDLAPALRVGEAGAQVGGGGLGQEAPAV